MVVHDHAQFGLAVVIVDRRAERRVEPAHDLRVQRFARAAHRAQPALHARGRFRPGRHQHPECGRRTREARDAEPVDHVVRAVDREAALVQRRRMTEQQRARDRVIEPVRPARIGDVPEPVAGTQVDRFAHVRAEREQRVQRHRHALRQARRARRRHHHEQVRPLARHGLERIGLRVERRAEIDVAHPQRLACFAYRRDRRAIGDFVELRAIRDVGHDEPRIAHAQPVLDRLRAERGKQRLVHGARAPRAEDRRDELRRARQQAGHHVARLHALRDEQVRNPGRQRLHLREREAVVLPAGVDPVERDRVRLRVPVATFDTRVQAALQIAAQLRGSGLDTETGHGVGVGRHRPGGSSFRHACLLCVIAADAPEARRGYIDSRQPLHCNQ